MDVSTPPPSPPPTSRRPAFGLRHSRALLLLAGVAAVAAAFVSLVVFVPLHYSAAQLRADLERQIHAATGLVVTRDGPASFGLWPQPHVEFEDVGFSDTTGGIRLEAAYLRGYPRLLPLLAGRVELASVTLHRPDLTIDLDAQALPPESAIGRAAAARSATQEAARADAVRLGIVVLEDGRARVKSRSAADATIDAINVTLDWRNLGAPVSLRGRAHIHHQPTDLALWIATPSELLRGGASAIRLQMHSDALTLSSSGSLDTAGGMAYQGRLSTTGASLHDMVALLGYDMQRQPAADDFGVRCDVEFADDRLTLSNLRLHLLQNDFEGAVAIQTRNQRKTMSGTLAADTLQLAPFMPARGTILGPDGGWSAAGFARGALDLADLDVRISAAHATLGDFEFANAALSLMTRPGGLEVSLADAALYSGTVRGRLALDADDEGVSAKLAATLTAVDAAALPWGASTGRGIAGRASGTLTLEGVGRDMADLVDDLAGRGDFTVEQGRMPGIDVEQALRRSEKRSQTSLLSAGGAGGTPFGLARVSLHVAQGLAQLDEATFSGPGSRITMNGHLDLRRGAVDLEALALQAGTDGRPSEAGPRVRFAVTGPWREPTVELRDLRPSAADAAN